MKPHFKRSMRSFIRIHLAVAALAIAFGCDWAYAEPRMPRITPETSLSESQMREALAASEELLTLGKQDFEVGLKRLLGPAHPKIVRFKAIMEQAQKVHALHQQLLPLLIGSRDEEKQKEITRLAKELRSLEMEMQNRVAQFDADISEAAAYRTGIERRSSETKAAEQLDAIRHELEATKKQLAERQMQLMETAKQMAKEQRDLSLPPLENAELRIFALKSLPASSAANAIEDLFGPKAIRFSIENQSNSLIVLGTQDSLQTIEALLTRLDQEAQEQNTKPPQSAKQPTTRSLLLRLFWLADGLPDGEGDDPVGVLPASVLRATNKLGLANPRLVAQTISSLAAGGKEAEEISASVPALLADQSVELLSQGNVTLAEADQATVTMDVRVHGKNVRCELQGSLAMPLGHYMVLGTANSLIPKSTTATDLSGQAPDAELGVASGEVGPEAGLVSPGAAPMEGGITGQPQPPKFGTSRFAFVVQLIPAESFPPEE